MAKKKKARRTGAATVSGLGLNNLVDLVVLGRLVAVTLVRCVDGVARAIRVSFVGCAIVLIVIVSIGLPIASLLSVRVRSGSMAGHRWNARFRRSARLRDHDTISGVIARDEGYEAAVPVGATAAFRTRRELGSDIPALRTLGDMFN